MVEVQKVHDVTIQKIGGTIDGHAISDDDKKSSSPSSDKKPKSSKQKSTIIFHNGESDGRGPGTIGL